MIKHIYLQMLLSLLVAFGIGNHADPGRAPESEPSTAKVDDDCSRDNVAFLPGEEVTYRIYYQFSPFWIAAGEVIFKVEDAGVDYKIKVNGYTYKSYEWFYKGIYSFESIIDKESLLPHFFTRSIEEKKYRRYNKFIFDHKNNKVTSWEGRTPTEAKLTVHDIGPCMHDMVSILYYVRNMNFKYVSKGDVFPVNVFLEEEYDLKVKVLGVDADEKVRGFGKLKTHIISPQVIAGDIFDEDTQMIIWVSADENKLPLMIESPVSVGKIKAVLVDYKGLRYDFLPGDE